MNPADSGFFLIARSRYSPSTQRHPPPRPSSPPHTSSSPPLHPSHEHLHPPLYRHHTSSTMTPQYNHNQNTFDQRLGFLPWLKRRKWNPSSWISGSGGWGRIASLSTLHPGIGPRSRICLFASASFTRDSQGDEDLEEKEELLEDLLSFLIISSSPSRRSISLLSIKPHLLLDFFSI